MPYEDNEIFNYLDNQEVPPILMEVLDHTKVHTPHTHTHAHARTHTHICIHSIVRCTVGVWCVR